VPPFSLKGKKEMAIAVKESGKKVLVAFSDGAPVSVANKTDVSITVTSGVFKLAASTTDWVTSGVKVGMRVLVEGFAQNSAFWADVSAVTTTNVTIIRPIDSGTAADLTLIAETTVSAPGVTMTFYTFGVMKGQREGALAISASSVDTSDKTTGAWGSKLAGNLNASVTLSGPCVFPDSIFDAAQAAILTQTPILLRLVRNAAGDHYVGLFVGTSVNPADGSADGVTSYSWTFENYGPVYYGKVS
jgi:predicted secreted protein